MVRVPQVTKLARKMRLTVFQQKQALEVLQGLLVTILAQYMRLKLTFFQQTLKRLVFLPIFFRGIHGKTRQKAKKEQHKKDKA